MSAREGVTRVAVVGTGAISQVMHLPILTERPDVDVALVSDLDEHKAGTVAERFGVPEVAEPAQALTRADLDAVLVCTPSHLHEDQAIVALRAGKHVFVERPLALTSEGAGRVLEAARKAGTTLTVGLPHRFRPEASALRSYIAGGEMGRVSSVRGIWLRRRVPLMRPTWRQKAELAGGGVLMDLGLPSLDLCLWLIGYPEVTRVACVTSARDYDVEDSAVLLAETVDGVAVTLEVSNRYFAEHDHYYARVMGSEGSGSLPPLEIYKQLGGRPLDVTPRQPRPQGFENPYTNAYRRQLDHFVRVASGVARGALPEEQVGLMRLMAAAYRSATTNREVTLSGS